MQAIVLTEYGDANQLQLKDWPEPEPGAGQIKVRVASASINPVDWKLRSGAARQFMPLEEAPAAQTLAERPGVGKVLLLPFE